jgi:hypothetical protein
MRTSKTLASLLTLTAFVGLATLAADDASFSKDLAATIALQGLPCGTVVSAQRNGDSDYTATCGDGNRYRVYVDPNGRVVATKL